MVSALLSLYGLSLAMCLGYIALPDYRYRIHIREYFIQTLLRRFHERGESTSSSDENTANIGRHKATIYPFSEKPDEYIAKYIINKLSTKEQEENVRSSHTSELQFLNLICNYLPKGTMPNEKKFAEFDVVDRKDIPTARHWFTENIYGRVFRKIYLTHWDNWAVLFVAFLMILGTIFAVWYEVFMLKDNPNAVSSFIFSPIGLHVHFVIGVLGLLLPTFLAFFGRVLICRSARKAIDDCVEKCMEKKIVDGVYAGMFAEAKKAVETNALNNE